MDHQIVGRNSILRERLTGLARELLFLVVDPPDEDMGIEEDHWLTDQSSLACAGSVGDS